MPKPLPYSDKTINAFFSDSLYTSSKAFNSIGQFVNAIEKIKAEKQKALKRGDTYDARKERAYQLELQEAYDNLKKAADAYVEYKEKKEEDERSEKEEARLAAAKKISLFADTCIDNCSDMHKSLELFEVLPDNVIVFSSIEAGAYTELVNQTGEWERGESKNKGDNPPFKPAGKDDFRVVTFIKYYKDLEESLKNDPSNIFMMDEADKILSDINLQNIIRSEIKLYNFKISKTDYGDKTPPKQIALPDINSKEFFKDLSENIKGNPDAAGLSDLIKTINSVKLTSLSLRNAYNKEKSLGAFNSKQFKAAYNKLKKNRASLDLEINRLKYAEMVKDENVRKEQIDTYGALHDGIAFKFTKEIQGKQVSATIKKEDAGFKYSTAMKDFINQYTPNKEGLELYLTKNNYNPLNDLTLITKYAKDLTAQLEKYPENASLVSASQKLLDSDAVKEMVVNTVKYLNTVSKYDAADKNPKKIELPTSFRNLDYYELGDQVDGIANMKNLSELAESMTKLSDVLEPISERHYERFQYDLSKEYFKKYIDKSMFPSDEFKKMRTEFNKLEHALDLPDDNGKLDAYYNLYVAACDYLLMKDPVLNEIPGAKLSEYEQTRVKFANDLRKTCIGKGIDVHMYPSNIAFEKYEKQKADIDVKPSIDIGPFAG